MNGLQIGLVSIAGFTALVTALFVTVRIVHPTRDEMHIAISDKAIKMQTIKSCELFHQTQDVRNDAFANALIEIKDEIRELRKDISEAIKTLMKDR